MKQRLLFIVPLCVIIAALLACGSSSNANTGTLTPPSSTATPTTQQHFHVGDTVTVGKTWQIVVSQPSTSTGEQYLTPKEGNVYLLIPVAFTNATNQEQSLYGNADWTLKDTAGQKYDPAYITSASPPSGKVEAGGPAKGTLAYEVPASLKEFRLSFEISMFSSGQTIWDLTIP